MLVLKDISQTYLEGMPFSDPALHWYECLKLYLEKQNITNAETVINVGQWNPINQLVNTIATITIDLH